MSKILFVTSGQPSLNPRVVKEADTLAAAGYEVVMLYTYWNKWGTEFDKQLLISKKWKAICVGGDPQHKWLTYFFSRLIYKIAKWISNKTNGRFMANFAVARASYFLINKAKKHTANLYIGHNLAALPAVITAAKINKKPCGFDAEDFHRNETNVDVNNVDVILKAHIENKYIPQLNYITTSSPQITEEYRQIFPDLKPVTLLNVFNNSSLITRQYPVGIDRPLKLFWFSQTIGLDRGLDDIIKALQLLNKEQFELHLLGDKPDKGFIDEINKIGITVSFHEPVFPNDIINFASGFDIGLALENKFPLNRDICLTNKIFTYMQAGLAVVASDTTAQLDFMNQNPQIGRVYAKSDSKALASILLDYYNHKEELIACQTNALQKAHHQYNWETESRKFLEVVKTVLKNAATAI